MPAEEDGELRLTCAVLGVSFLTVRLRTKLAIFTKTTGRDPCTPKLRQLFSRMRKSKTIFVMMLLHFFCLSLASAVNIDRSITGETTSQTLTY